MDYSDRLKRIVAGLPEYCTRYLDDRAKDLTEGSLYMYGVDLNHFFHYLSDKVYDKSNVTFVDLMNLTNKDIAGYMSYLTEYEYDGRIFRNSSGSKQRKLVVLRSFFSYMKTQKYIDNDPTAGVPVPSKNKKNAKDLGETEIETILTFVKDPESFKDNRKKNEIHRRNMARNYLILVLLLCYQLSPREVAALNVSDVREDYIQYHEKGKMKEITLSAAHMAELKLYIIGKENARCSYGSPKRVEDQDALFFSRKKNRISIRNIEVLSADYKKSGIMENHKE